MVKNILMDQVCFAVLVPRGLPDPEYRSIRRTLDNRAFTAGLGRAVRRVFRTYSSLAKVKIRMSR